VTTAIDQAGDYIRRGWHVVPVLPGEKVPGFERVRFANADPHLVALLGGDQFPAGPMRIIKDGPA
jgi:hypothetical protein